MLYANFYYCFPRLVPDKPFFFNRLTWHLFDSYYLVEARGINETFHR